MFSNDPWADHPSLLGAIPSWIWWVAGLLILFFILDVVLKTQCPKCKKFFMREVREEELLRIEEYIKPVTRKTDQVDGDGKPIWVTEDKLHRRKDYRIHFSCSKCGNISGWFKDKSEETIVFK